MAADKSHVEPLVESLLTARPEYFGVIRDTLESHRGEITNTLWNEFHRAEETDARRFRAGVALARYAVGSEKWCDDDYRFLAVRLVSSNPEQQPVWRSHLGQPVGDACLSALEQLFERAESAEMQLGAANAIAQFAADDHQRLARLLTFATPKQYEILFPLVAAHPDKAATNILATIASDLPADDLSTVERIAHGRRRAGAGITLLRLGERESVLPTFDLRDDPEAITQFIHRCRDRSVLAEELVECLRAANSSTTRYGLLLALAEYPPDEIPAGERESLIDEVADWYANDPSSAVHAAAGWLLRAWGEDETVKCVDQTPVPYAPDREWFTMAITVQPPARPDADDAAAAAPRVAADVLLHVRRIPGG